MEEMKVCFVGVGSIAKRHIRNLHEIGKQRGIKFKIDAYRRNIDMVEGIEQIYISQEDITDNYDIIFITNPTSKHLDSLVQFQSKGKHFFIEKPVTSLNEIAQARNTTLKSGSVYYVACPLRYNAVIQYIKNRINLADVISVRSISSSYLPAWRPGQDYRKTYSAHKDMGGGVSIDLIHEWDYIMYLFGLPNKVRSLIGKKSSLEIDSDDFAIYIAEYDRMIAELHLDYFGRQTIREIQLFTTDDTIVGDIVHNRITYLKSGKSIEFDEKRDDFQKRELNHFLDMVLGVEVPEDGFHHGLTLLELTQGRLEG